MQNFWDYLVFTRTMSFKIFETEYFSNLVPKVTLDHFFSHSRAEHFLKQNTIWPFVWRRILCIFDHFLKILTEMLIFKNLVKTLVQYWFQPIVAHFVHFWSFFENRDWDAHVFSFYFFLQIKRFHEIFHQMFHENLVKMITLLQNWYQLELISSNCGTFCAFLIVFWKSWLRCSYFFFLFFADRAFAEKQRYDGWYNNLAHPNWGSAGKSYDLCRYLVSLAEFNENFCCHFSGV